MIERIGWVRWPEVGLPGRAGVSKYYPPRHSSRPRNRTVSNRFISYNCCQQLIRLPQIVNDRCASSENKYHTNGGFWRHTCFFSRCAFASKKRTMIQYFLSLSGNPTLAGTKQYHFLIIAFLLQQSVRGLFKEETKLQSKKPLLHQMRAMDGWNWRCVIFFLAKQRLF